VPREDEDDLTSWEKMVYSYYRVFHHSSRVKYSTKRRCIPTTLELSLLPELQNIIVHPKNLKIIKRDEIPSEVPDNVDSEVLYEELWVAISKYSKCTKMNVYYMVVVFEFRKPDAFIPVTKDVLRAQKKFEERKAEKPSRTLKRTQIRNQKKAAAKQRWKKQKEKERQKLLTHQKSMANPLEILGPTYEPADMNISESILRYIAHDHTYAFNPLKSLEQNSPENESGGSDLSSYAVGGNF